MALRHFGLATTSTTEKRRANLPAKAFAHDFMTKNEGSDAVLGDKYVWNGPPSQAVAVADTGWLTGSTFTPDLGTWTNTGNIYVDDGTFAQVVVAAGNEGSGWVSGWTGLSIPSGATILGIEVRANAKNTVGTNGYSYAFVMTGSGFLNRCTTSQNPSSSQQILPSVLTPFVYGARGNTWDDFDANNDNIRDRAWATTDFTSSFSAYVAYGSTATSTVQIDSVKLRVTYSTPVVSSNTGQMKTWNGSAWVLKPVKVWDGATWVTKPLKRWSGSAWVLTP
jgi:hypothetical protein